MEQRLEHKGTRPIETPRLMLRRFLMGDEKNMFDNWASDSEVTKYLTWRAHSNRKITHDVLTSWCSHYRMDTYQWAIVWKETGEVIGSIGVVTLEETSCSGDIGYALSRRYWGRDIMPEAGRAMLCFLFERVRFLRLTAKHDVRNPNSGRVMQKLGMTERRSIEGVFRDNQGELCTVSEYELTREDFESVTVRKALEFEIFEIGKLYYDLSAATETRDNGPGWKRHVYPRTSNAKAAWEKGELYAAVQAGRVVGTVILNENQEDAYRTASFQYQAERALVIHTLAVHPDCMGTGIGSALLAFAEEHAVRTGCRVIRLDTYLYNSPAIRLYEKSGYRRADRVDLGLGAVCGLWWFYVFEKCVDSRLEGGA